MTTTITVARAEGMGLLRWAAYVDTTPSPHLLSGGGREEMLPAYTRWGATRRAHTVCRRYGGHKWTPNDPMIEWRCTQCGLLRDGWPKDGS